MKAKFQYCCKPFKQRYGERYFLLRDNIEICPFCHKRLAPPRNKKKEKMNLKEATDTLDRYFGIINVGPFKINPDMARKAYKVLKKKLAREDTP